MSVQKVKEKLRELTESAPDIIFDAAGAVLDAF